MGSVNYDDVEIMICMVVDMLGDWFCCIFDGEVGKWFYWIMF